MATKSGVRLVKCPRCYKILPENLNIRLYKCGGCGSILKAKTSKDNEEGSNSVSDLHPKDTDSKFRLNKNSIDENFRSDVNLSGKNHQRYLQKNKGEGSTLNLEKTKHYHSDSSVSTFSTRTTKTWGSDLSIETLDIVSPDNRSDRSRISEFTEAPCTDTTSMEYIHLHSRNLMGYQIYRPIFGGAPFVICNNCFQLLRVLECMIQISKQRFMFRCGNCSELDAAGLKNSAKVVSLNKKIDTKDHEVEQGLSLELIENKADSLQGKNDELRDESTIKYRKERGYSTSESRSHFPPRYTHLPFKNLANRQKPGCEKGTGVDRSRTLTAVALKRTFKGRIPQFQNIRDEYRETVDELIETGHSEHIFSHAIQGYGCGQIVETVAEIQERNDALLELEKKLQELKQIVMQSAQRRILFDGTIVYGRKYDVTNIIGFILSDDCRGNVTITCIVAGGGMGKTTIAQLVYNDKVICDAFENRIFICMSENYDEKRTIKEIIEACTHVPCDITDLSKLKEIAKDELKEKIFFIIVDDADHKLSQRFWCEIVGLLNNGAKGSALLVTTKSTTFIDTIGADHSYHLSMLSSECCWHLFKSRAFYGYNPNDRPDLVEIGKKLVSSCTQNPLCIKMLADLLHQSITTMWWSTISESCLTSTNETDEGYLLPELRVCYNSLPEHLKRCFMYCSLFPKNYVFSKHHLVRLWLSEGFIEPVTGKKQEKVGNEYFDDLVGRSFFEHLHTCESKEDKFVVHDIIHELAEKVSSNRYFRSEGCLQKVPESTSFLSVVPYEFQTISIAGLTTETKDLQTTLFVGGSRFLSEPEDAFMPLVPVVGLDDLFTECRGLTTLDLSSTAIEELPHSIAFLTCLKYLGLNTTNIKSIPTCISKLIALQTLEAKNCYYLTELPETLKELETLRHLDVTNEWNFVAMPRGIGKLTNIVSLASFHVGSDPAHSKIEELDKLENLQGSLKISGIENITFYEDVERANIQGKPNIETLSLQWGSTATYPEEEEDEEENQKDAAIAEKVLENLRPNNNLEELIIRNYGGNRFPIWLEDTAFWKLVSIILDNCYRCIVFPALGRLPSLRYLSINKMYGVCRMIDDRSIRAANSSMYPSLELLNLSELYGLEEWPERNNQDFPQLRALSINKCPFIRRIPHLPTLHELSISYGQQFPEISDLPSLESLKIEGFQKVKSIYLSCHFGALKKLEIRHCKELFSVASSSQFPSTTKIKIVACQKLNLGNIHLTSPISTEE